MKNHEKSRKPRSDPPDPVRMKPGLENLQKYCFLLAGEPSEPVCDQCFAWIGRNLLGNNRKPVLVGFRTKYTEKQEKTPKKHQKSWKSWKSTKILKNQVWGSETLKFLKNFSCPRRFEAVFCQPGPWDVPKLARHRDQPWVENFQNFHFFNTSFWCSGGAYST